FAPLTHAQLALIPLPGAPLTANHPISSDGSTVIGGVLDSHGIAWRLGPPITTLDLGPVTGTYTALQVSADGSTIVGTENIASLPPCFRWTSSGGRQELRVSLNGSNQLTFAPAADGSFAVGTAITGTGASAAVRWTGLFLPDILGTVNGSTYNAAHAVAPNGT